MFFIFIAVFFWMITLEYVVYAWHTTWHTIWRMNMSRLHCRRSLSLRFMWIAAMSVWTRRRKGFRPPRTEQSLRCVVCISSSASSATLRRLRRCPRSSPVPSLLRRTRPDPAAAFSPSSSKTHPVPRPRRRSNVSSFGRSTRSTRRSRRTSSVWRSSTGGRRRSTTGNRWPWSSTGCCCWSSSSPRSASRRRSCFTRPTRASSCSGSFLLHPADRQRRRGSATPAPPRRRPRASHQRVLRRWLRANDGRSYYPATRFFASFS